eukprot:scaffold1194_cov127-Cylindrotheca_fusiformis.AAC.27
MDLARSAHHSAVTLVIISFVLLALKLVVSADASDIEVTDLPFGDINVLVVTDVHSHIGGHKHESDRDADYGDVLSFYERLKQYCDDNGRDLWFVNNGDWMHGTGLAMGGNASSLVPLLNEMPWDAITLGNHELYHHATVQLINSSMLPNFADQFVSSNVEMISHDGLHEPLGKKYILLEGANHRVLVFGFIYDLDLRSPKLNIDKVEDVINEEWFKAALKEEEYDAIMVLAHMDFEDHLIDIIDSAIRSNEVGDDMPIQFIAGHTHKRDQRRIGLWTHAYEAGGNLDTLGFVSFPVIATAKAKPKEAKQLFGRTYLNTSVDLLSSVLGDPDPFRTANGEDLSRKINETRHFLRLDEVVACPLQDYHLNNHMLGKQSLWGLWQMQVAPNEICEHEKRCIVLVSSSTFRYGVRGSASSGDEMTLDDVVAIAPNMEPVYYVGEVNDYAIQRLNSSLNIHSNQHGHTIPTFVMSGQINDRGDYHLYTHERDLKEILPELERLYVTDVMPKATGNADTLYWLNYAQEAWPCTGLPKNKKIDPWFKSSKALQLEVDDTEDSSDEEPWFEPDDGQYHGYVPGDDHEVRHPDYNVPKQETAADRMRERAEAAEKKRIQKAKTRKKIFNSLAVLAGIIILCVPLYYMLSTIFKKEEQFDPDEVFYDRKELAAFKKNRMKPMDIEIT